MRSAFRKISRARSILGSTRWYLSEDCLLAAKRLMYSVEYRRFYLHDLEYVMVWPSRLWLWRLTIPAVLSAALGVSFWRWVNSISGAIFTGIAIGWVAIELAFGPTAESRIRTTGATVELPLVTRTRRARKVLAKIDRAVRATRGAIQQPTALAATNSPAEPPVQTKSETTAIASIAAATQTNGS